MVLVRNPDRVVLDSYNPRDRMTWLVRSNPALDALCLLNVLTGDPFYTSQHPGLFERWQPRLAGDALEAFRRLEGALRPPEGGIISAALCLLFSSQSPQTLDDLERAALEPTEMLRAYRASPYWDEQEARSFAKVIPEVLLLVRFLRAHGFELEWVSDFGAGSQDKLAELQQALERYPVVAAVEQALGHALEVQDIEVFVLAYTAPHGIKLIGHRFVTAPQWSAAITVRVAVHELMHPPFDLQRPELQAALEVLAQNPELHAAFADHDAKFGYNTWAGYVEENCVRALDQVISESFGIAREASERWAEEDGGMHKLAARLTPLLRQRVAGDRFEDWLIAQVQQGAFSPTRQDR